jgi:hypothetical protein
MAYAWRSSCFHMLSPQYGEDVKDVGARRICETTADGSG